MPSRPRNEKQTFESVAIANPIIVDMKGPTAERAQPATTARSTAAFGSGTRVPKKPYPIASVVSGSAARSTISSETCIDVMQALSVIKPPVNAAARMAVSTS